MWILAGLTTSFTRLVLPVVALMLSPQERALAETPAAAAYSYEAEVIENQAAHLWFTYKNLSGESHCVRTADLNFDFYSDSILVTNRNGKVMSYVGPTASGVRQRDLGELKFPRPGCSRNDSVMDSASSRPSSKPGIGNGQTLVLWQFRSRSRLKGGDSRLIPQCHRSTSRSDLHLGRIVLRTRLPELVLHLPQLKPDPRRPRCRLHHHRKPPPIQTDSIYLIRQLRTQCLHYCDLPLGRLGPLLGTLSQCWQASRD